VISELSNPRLKMVIIMADDMPRVPPDYQIFFVSPFSCLNYGPLHNRKVAMKKSAILFAMPHFIHLKMEAIYLNILR
jgi:hypothetical protein